MDINKISEWAGKNISSRFKIAGISSDKELFIETTDHEYFYSEEGSEEERKISELIRDRFDVGKVTFVVKPSLSQVNDIIKGLNVLLEPRKNLLDLEDF